MYNIIITGGKVYYTREETSSLRRGLQRAASTTLASSRQLAVESIRRAQLATRPTLIEELTNATTELVTMVKFPQEEQGKLRKLSHAWHGPYRRVACSYPNVSVTKVHYPKEGAIPVHQERVCFCPPELSVEYFGM